MNESDKPLNLFLYFILGLIVLIVAVQILGWVFGALIKLVALALTVILVIAVGYVAWVFLKSAFKA